jgi:carboxyl-terminal processing protease
MPEKSPMPRWSTILAAGLPISIMLLALSIVYAAKARSSADADEIYQQGNRFFLIKEKIENAYLFEPDSWQLLYQAIGGMVRSLDEYSEFFEPSRQQRFREETSGEYEGIGIVIHNQGPPITVRYCYPGSPAYVAGLKPGDRILEVEGQSTSSIKLDNAQRLIKGPPGGKVHLKVAHEGSDRVDEFEVERAQIVQDSVFEARIIDSAQGIGYLRINAFQEATHTEFRDRVDALLKEGLRSLIVDVRHNGGGLFDPAKDIANYFIESGNLVSLRGRAPGTNQDFPADPKLFRYRDLPLVILMDEQTASAAEVLAGALQDYKKALLLGTRSYGKGVVQSVMQFRMRENEDAVLKLTTAEYVTPGGQHLDRKVGQHVGTLAGLRPDYDVPLKTDMRNLEKAFEIQRIPAEFRTRVLEMLGTTVVTFEDNQLDAAVRLLHGEPIFRDLSAGTRATEAKAGK